jgi:hypothetical protein
MAWAAVRLLPCRWYAPLLGRQETVPPPSGDPEPEPSTARAADGTSNSHDDVALTLMRCLRRGCRFLPWHSTCLMQAMAGQVMLRRRSLPGVVYFGFRRGGGGQDFHAWLQLGGVPVSGGRDATDCVVLAIFR